MPTPNVSSILATLKKKGKEQTRKIYRRHGAPADRVLGVSTADMKSIAKTIKGQQDLACQIYDTGLFEAMYLAGMVADGARMTRKQLQGWAETAVAPMISEYTVPWVTVENSAGRELALEWIESKKENVASAGWSAYSGLLATKPDSELDLKEIEGLLARIPKEMGRTQNRVRYTMNGFVIAVGTYVRPLAAKAKATARQIGNVSVEVGETACEVPVAAERIAKVEAAGRIGQKRKTIRC